jgi:hypothetical protein
MSEAISVQVLREEGPLSLRDVTRLTARKMGCSLTHEGVAAVLESAARRGEVVCIGTGGDYRNNIWAPVPVSSSLGSDQRRKR